MNPDLHDNSWTLGGTSLLWDADALNRICPAESVRSLREFLRLYQSDWPEDALKLINGRTLVVAGLEAAMDTLSPDQAVEWLEKVVYEAIYDFQQEIAGGGTEAALILWLADSKRIFHQVSDESYHWHCSGAHRQDSLPLGRCVWNGAEKGVRRIIVRSVENKESWAGLFLQRIS
jgi:hypothetical protein